MGFGNQGAFVVGELSAIVVSQRVDLDLVRREARYNVRMNCLGSLGGDCPDDGVRRLALDQCD